MLDQEKENRLLYDDDDEDDDDIEVGYSPAKRQTVTNNSSNPVQNTQQSTNNTKYWATRGGQGGLSRGGAFILRMIIAIVVISILESINFFLGLLGLIIYIFIEASCR